MAPSDASAKARLGPLEYGGPGAPEVVIASDLPHDGPIGWVAEQVREAVRLVLAERGWRAGRHRVGYRPCDGADGHGGLFSDRLAAANARALVKDPAVVALLGPFNSAAAAAALLVTARAGLAMVSPSTTYVGLSSPGPAFRRDEPARYAPEGRRAYLRVFPNDHHQAAAIAQLLAARGVTAPYVLHDGEPYGRSIAEALVRTAPVAGLRLAGLQIWNDEEDDAETALGRIGVSRADALVLCGVPHTGTRELVKRKLELLGPNDGRVVVVGTDAFTEIADLEAADGVRVVAPGLRPGAYPPAGERFVDRLAQRLDVDRGLLEPYAIHGAEAADLVLEAIADSDGTRAGVLAALFAAEREEGPLGAFHFGENGDAVPAGGGVVCGFTVYTIADGALEPESSILPRPALLAAASS
jgi:branched-chain amino acid transport system substrate-binding protein